jgi:hypothetical protein
MASHDRQELTGVDEIVKAALAKWPNVPACYGWLGLDERGQWFMRDDRVQAQGPFAGEASTVASRGAPLKHEKLIDFIARNYEADAQGCWFFQNGPQRVYVELQATPWIWRVEPDFSLLAHTGRPARAQRSWIDEAGRLYLETDLGFGLVHTQDMVRASEAVEHGLWVPHEVLALEMPKRFDYVASPAAARSAAA